MKLRVGKIDHEDASVRRQLFEFLAPHEAHCLFITGNLKSDFPDSHLYVASRGAEWVGIAGYYAGPRSVIPFSTDPQIARVLARHVAEIHPDIDYLNAVAAVAEPACEELRLLGYEVAGNPRSVFMQLEALPPTQPHEELARLATPEDDEAVAKLLRILRNEPQEPPVTEEELRRVRMSPYRLVLVADGRIVSVTSTNGVGISAFQLLGVATHHQHRNKGYARAVCASLIRTMWTPGVRQAVLFTALDNVAAQACYQGLGFHKTGEFWVTKLMRTPSN